MTAVDQFRPTVFFGRRSPPLGSRPSVIPTVGDFDRRSFRPPNPAVGKRSTVGSQAVATAE
jgi:hypothetical protein